MNPTQSFSFEFSCPASSLEQKSNVHPVDSFIEKSSHEKIQPKDDNLFEKKLFRKLTKHVDHPMHEWVLNFAQKLAYHNQGTREYGIALANKLLDFPKESKVAQAVRDNLQELLYSTAFLNKATFIDEWAQNPADELLKKFAFAVEATTKSYPLVRLSEVPENLVINVSCKLLT